MADNETPQIVAPTPLNDQIASGIRVMVLAIGLVTTLAGFVSRRDLAGFIVYVQTNEFLATAGLLVSVGMFTWGQWKTRHRAKQLNAVAQDVRVPDAVIVTKEKAA